MFNLVIALAIGAAFFILGVFVSGGEFIAGFIPALIAFGTAYVLLARRTGKKFQALMARVGAALQKQRLREGVQLLESARKLGRWQFLIGPQVDAQLGALAYLQRDWPKARKHLVKAWKRDWHAVGMLAAMDYREGEVDAAVQRLKKVRGAGKKEGVYWALSIYFLASNKRYDDALAICTEAAKALPDNQALKKLRGQVANRRKLKMKPLGQTWYQFFPEHIPQKARIQHPPGRRQSTRPR
jgi:tetratricopeptide (TPR) repeat protein